MESSQVNLTETKRKGGKMTSEYYTEIAFPASHESVNQVLVSMKRSLDNYKLKSNANQKWIEEREMMIAKIIHFINTSRETIRVLNQDYKEAFSQGLQKGIKKGKQQAEHQSEFGNLSKLNPRDKEQIRAATIFNAYQKWDL